MTKISNEIISCLSELSCESVAEKLGINVNRHKSLCFMHDDHHPSLAYYGKNREFWKCFVCNKGGNAINMVMEYTGWSFVDSCFWLGNNFGILMDNTYLSKKTIHPPLFKKKRQQAENKQFATNIAEWILQNNNLTELGINFLFNKRKIKSDIIKQLNIVSLDESKSLVERLNRTFESKELLDSGFLTMTGGKLYFRMFTPCLIFPYYDLNMNLIGIQSRYLGTNKEAPRFQFISNQKSRLFNLQILNSIKFGDDLYISEGITDCLALLSSGKKAVAIPSATILPQTDLIKLKTFKLHMYPDKDKAGRMAYISLRRFFINHYTTIKEEQLPEGCKDYSDYYITTNAK